MLKAIKRKIFSFFIAYMGKFLLRLILSTCKIEVKGFDAFKKIAQTEKCILMLWHNRLSIVSEILNKLDKNTVFAAFISKSKDGDPLAVLANSYKNGKAIRVAHDRKHQALLAVIDTLNTSKEVVIITPDGPRGPRYKVKPGIIVAAYETKASIVPFTFTPSRFWQLKSWDRLIFPKPFSKIIVTFGDEVKIEDKLLPENQAILEEIVLNLECNVNAHLFDNPNDWPK
jgi:lysophospholipid acyltransferase (LPLAT)-like uncharacterized protein